MNFQADSAEELSRVLAAMDVSLPPRSQGRTKEHVERWTACRLFATLAAQGLIAFPFSARKRERPDFDLTVGTRQVGLEVSEALLANYAEHVKLQESESPDALMEPGHFRRGRVSKAKQREILAAGQLTALPYMGEALEREWATGIASVIQAKLVKLSRPGFNQRPTNWLAIMDSLPIHNDWIPVGLKYLDPLISSVGGQTPSFDQVFIDHGGPTLVVLNKAGASIVEIDNLWPRREF